MRIDINDKNIMRQMGNRFNFWARFGNFDITEEDVRYIQIIRSHPCYPLVHFRYSFAFPIIERANIRINKIVFYEHFYYDSACPHGVKNILFCMIGLERHGLDEQGLLPLFRLRYSYVEKWIDSVTRKSSP